MIAFMEGLYPIIRRKRKPLVETEPVGPLAAPAKAPDVMPPKPSSPGVPKPADETKFVQNLSAAPAARKR